MHCTLSLQTAHLQNFEWIFKKSYSSKFTLVIFIYQHSGCCTSLHCSMLNRICTSLFTLAQCYALKMLSTKIGHLLSTIKSIWSIKVGRHILSKDSDHDCVKLRHELSLPHYLEVGADIDGKLSEVANPPVRVLCPVISFLGALRTENGCTSIFECASARLFFIMLRAWLLTATLCTPLIGFSPAF